MAGILGNGMGGGGILGGGILNSIRQNPEVVSALAAGFLNPGGQGTQGALGAAAQNLGPAMATSKKRAALNVWLKSKSGLSLTPEDQALLGQFPELASSIAANTFTPKAPMKFGPGDTAYDPISKAWITPPNATNAYRPATADEKKAYGVPDGTPLSIGPGNKPDVLGSGYGAAVNADDVSSIVDGVMSGDVPPDLKGIYRLKGPVTAELARRGFDISKATADYTSTMRLLSTMNGTQQTRMRQAVGQVKEALPLVDDLAEQWKAGGFPALNTANRVAAEQGLLGPEAQKIVVNLKSAIADVTAEMGTVLVGGNSPTDHSLELAAQNLSVDWSYPTLKAALAQMDKLIGYREVSLRLGTAGIPDSQYNQMQATPVIDPNASGAAPVPGAPPAVASPLSAGSTAPAPPPTEGAAIPGGSAAASEFKPGDRAHNPSTGQVIEMQPDGTWKAIQ